MLVVRKDIKLNSMEAYFLKKKLEIFTDSQIKISYHVRKMLRRKLGGLREIESEKTEELKERSMESEQQSGR